jgi:hypothetical protein
MLRDLENFFSTLTDASGAMVARATVRWKLGPIPPTAGAQGAV